MTLIVQKHKIPRPFLQPLAKPGSAAIFRIVTNLWDWKSKGQKAKPCKSKKINPTASLEDEVSSLSSAQEVMCCSKHVATEWNPFSIRWLGHLQANIKWLSADILHSHIPTHPIVHGCFGAHKRKLLESKLKTF